MQKSFITRINSLDFQFTKNDNIDDLPAPIKGHMKTFITNRVSQFEILREAIDEEDFEEIRLFCHAQLGVAGSYNCFKLEEITLYIQDFARQEVMAPITAAAPILEGYLQELKQGTY